VLACQRALAGCIGEETWDIVVIFFQFVIFVISALFITHHAMNNNVGWVLMTDYC
jgi:hypothetical protein